ncbi:DUF4239 domain-containing protein [Methylocystis sp. WRRC1]|uniref:bestrophin-like domain n=1 Tax=Methylocystis sp. WRRC1 TaxID=1732014 RepID=UPI001D14E929|nr:DUF4239 domain-containing protein [Methylocystis sp. WRRC1]MCC3246460.1 DUF4239 domain-containing protein [Methylocystis sp. WRRC1]
MSVTIVCLIGFVCVFGGSLAGMILGAFLPEHHLSDQSIDTIKAARGVIVGLAALTVGLLVASAKSSFDLKGSELRSSAAKIIVLDRTLEKYGPKAEEARDQVRQVVINGIARVHAAHAQGADAERLNTGAIIDNLQRKLLALRPENEDQAWLKSSALSIGSEIANSRWQIYESLSSSLQWPFLAVLLFWLSGIFFSFGLTAPRNASVVTALFVAAASVTGAIYLILELDMPFMGLIQLSTEPLELALDQLKR